MTKFKQIYLKMVFLWLIFGFAVLMSPQILQAESSFKMEEEDSPKSLLINNNGGCAVNIYWWISTGDVFYTTIQPGGHWTVTTYAGHKWRAVDTDNVWSNLQFDENYMTTSSSNQTWNINPNYCGNCTGEITGFLLNKQNGSALTALTNGMTFCESDFPNDIKIRTTESGSHESLKYTITTPTGTVSNTENLVTYDSHQFWPTPGAYTIKAELYSHDNLGGTKCDEKMISFTVEDCSDPCDNVTSGGQIAGNEEGCVSYDPAPITNLQSPTGGSGTIEYLWLSSTTACPTQLSQAIQGATSATYDPGMINQTTWYVRCSRRNGCTVWTAGESNCVIKTVNAPPAAMSEGQNPTCGNNDGKITFFFSDHPTRTNIEFSIDGGITYPYGSSDAIGSSMATNLGTGTYGVWVRWGDDDCPTDLGNVTLVTEGGDADNDGVCDADDCRPNDANISNPGDACNDGNGNTINDVIQADCSCAGTPINITINDVTVNENAGSASLTISLSEASNQNVTVVYNTSNGTAQAPGDYSTSTGTITIPAGQTSVTVTIPITDDTTDEPDETFNVNLSNANGGNIADNQGIVTILDNDAVQIIPNITINDVTVNENAGSASLTISLSEASNQNVTVVYNTSNGTAQAPGDYSTSTGTITIPAGQTSVTVTIPITDDLMNEQTEVFNVNLSNANGGNIADNQGTVTILDDDAVQIIPNITINDVTVNENAGSASLTISLSEASNQNVTVVYNTSNGTAQAPGDYSTSTGTITIPAGQTSVTVTIPITDDLMNEQTEVFNVNLSNANGGNIADNQGTVTILDDDAVQIIPNITINDVTVNENAGSASLTISLSEASNQNVTVVYNTSNGTAQAPGDYSTSTGTITIPAGQTSVTVTIPITDDLMNEQTEVFNVNLSNANGGNIADNQGTVTILDDDMAPGGCQATYSVTGKTITVNGISAPISLVKIIDASWNTVFECNPWTANGCGSSVSFTVPTCGNYQVQIQTFTDWSNQVCNILDPVTVNTDCGGASTPNITIGDLTVNENAGTASVVVTLSQATNQDVTVNYVTSNGTAQDGTDYTGGNGSITIPAGLTTGTIVVPIVNDMAVEPTEVFNVNLTTATGGNITDVQGVVTILDDDTAPTGCNATYTVTGRTIEVENFNAPIVLIKVIDATWNTVYECTPWSGAGCGTAVSYTVPTCGTYYLQIQTYSDWSNQICNLLETVIINSNCGGQTAPNVTVNDVTVNENAGTATLTVGLDQASNQPVTVTYSTSNGTAQAPGDYSTSTGTVTIPAGQTSVSVTITITITDDAANEPTEVFNLNLNSATGGNITDPVGTVTILDNDAVQTTPSITINDITVNENAGSATLTVSLSGTTNQPVTVVYNTSNGTAQSGSDYTPSTGTITVPAGQTSATVTIPILDDLTNEPTELFNVTLTNPNGGNIADPLGTVTILDNDAVQVTPNITIGDVTVNENDGTATVTVSLSGTTNQPVTVTYNTSNGTAQAPGDYTTSTGTVTIPAGQTTGAITVPITDDNADEMDESFNINLSNPNGGNIADAQGVVTILDDDMAPTGCQATYTVTGRTITVNNINAPITLVKVIDATWNGIAECTPWAGAGCGNSYSYTVPTCGTYYLQIQTYTDWSNQICNLLETVEVDSDCGGGPTVSNITINDVTVNENDGTATVTVNLDQPSAQPVTVTYNTSNGSAQAPGDYTTSTGTITIPAGQTSATVTVPIVNDMDVEQNETFNINLSNPIGGATINDANGIVTIIDNDQPASNCDVQVTTAGSKITVSNISGAITAVKFLDASWNVLQSCDDWTNACGTMEMYTVAAAGTYYVQVQTYADWSTPICDLFETVVITGNPDPCANNGGDADGDGVCANQDCDDNNPNISSPGDACNDGNANTNNDVIQADCSCAGTPIVPTCDNVTNGGTITGDETNCGAYDPAPIMSATLPSGGSGAMEYIWFVFYNRLSKSIGASNRRRNEFNLRSGNNYGDDLLQTLLKKSRMYWK